MADDGMMDSATSPSVVQSIAPMVSPHSGPATPAGLANVQTETETPKSGSGTAQSAYALVKHFRSSVVSFVTSLVVPDFQQRLIRSSDAVPLATKLRAAWRKINDTEFWMACKVF